MNAEVTYNDQVLMEVRNLKKWFSVGSGLFNRGKSFVKAVDDISLTINYGETLGQDAGNPLWPGLS